VTLPIITERLLLRGFADEDVHDVVHFLSHPSVARATPEIEATQAGVKKYIDMQNAYSPFEQDKCFDLAIERVADHSVIGLLTLITRKHEQGELGYALGVDFRDQGYATEAASGLVDYAFSALKLHRIQAETSSANPGSYRVMERLGMRREGHMREATFRDGAWLDVFVYGILAREWDPMRD
jgi:RimJ/RimL family protein N-acetyltransferase